MADQETQVVVVGGGPGGYAAAFHSADLGMETTLIDVRERPGGVCLFVGCIPSKTLLHVADIIQDAREAGQFGLDFAPPKIDIDKLRGFKDQVVYKLTSGLSELAKVRKVRYIRAKATFEDSHTLRLEGSGTSRLRFQHAVLATGSVPTPLPGNTVESPRLMDSTAALDLKDVPSKLLVIGAGYIGLELGSVYATLGSQVTLVELLDGLLPGVDRDLVRPLEKRVRELFAGVHLKTKVVGMREVDKGLEVEFEGEIEPKKQVFDRVLVSIGRTPNSRDIGLENTRAEVDQKGFVRIDRQCRTADPAIFAIGDVAGQPMLAHKAMREGKVAVEVIAGKKTVFDNRAVPAVVFTNPEIAWAGLSESEARSEGRKVKVVRFPWAASGRAVTIGRTDGLTKMIFDEESGQILGVGITGPRAGELIAEGTLAIEMGAVAEDLALTIHTHPTLSETIGEVAEAFLGHATHIYRK
ncbi:MAG TPA: dihydrolipoyl dehydrogenase [Acidobacteriota bacterium]|nr:dihydrolipoyl dehydrogenase [Acidobacteriota bacterium]